MTRRELIDHCLTLSAVYEDYPFDDETAVIRHTENKKIFALFINRNGREFLNLKCDPFEADFLRQAFEGIIPAYHMNKEHWNTVVIGADIPEPEIFRQIENSYTLTKSKSKKVKSK
ncbi:MAG: MmcQ/YjbR family DNA-binding protein [Clostridiales bacterium]|jgi:predicted DNA-binding protein (MmcQ/YjbR family)|nr:MmcQ/YjbR family DNA-binding protein [Clostridiales bacterium]